MSTKCSIELTSSKYLDMKVLMLDCWGYKCQATLSLAQRALYDLAMHVCMCYSVAMQHPETVNFVYKDTWVTSD